MPAFFARGTYSPTFVEVVLGNKAPRVPRLSANCAINQRRAKPLSSGCPDPRGIAVQLRGVRTGPRFLAGDPALRLHEHARRSLGAGAHTVPRAARSGVRDQLHHQPGICRADARRQHGELAQAAFRCNEPQRRRRGGVLSAAQQRGGGARYAGADLNPSANLRSRLSHTDHETAIGCLLSHHWIMRDEQ